MQKKESRPHRALKCGYGAEYGIDRQEIAAVISSVPRFYNRLTKYEGMARRQYRVRRAG